MELHHPPTTAQIITARALTTRLEIAPYTDLDDAEVRNADRPAGTIILSIQRDHDTIASTGHTTQSHRELNTHSRIRRPTGPLRRAFLRLAIGSIAATIHPAAHPDTAPKDCPKEPLPCGR
jgi:hypothetical protein